jgi:hypothetical protein
MDSIFIWKEISVKNTIKMETSSVYLYTETRIYRMALTRGCMHKDSIQEIVKILPLKELESAFAEKFKQACEHPLQEEWLTHC